MKLLWTAFALMVVWNSSASAQTLRQICEISQTIKKRRFVERTVIYKDEVLKQNSTKQMLLIFPNRTVDPNFAPEDIIGFEQARKLIGALQATISRNGSVQKIELSRFTVSGLSSGNLAGIMVAAGEGNISDRLQVTEVKTGFSVTCYQKASK